MSTFIMESVRLHIPDWVVSLDTFRQWTEVNDFPSFGRIWWLLGEVWADMSREQLFSHLDPKKEITRVLGTLVKAEKRGRLFPDGLLLSNFEAEISGNPDLTFVSYETLRSDRVRLLEGPDDGFTEIQGSPDLVLEIVSKSSVKKDTVDLRQKYWEAGIPEYWLVDALTSAPLFDILQYTPNGYREVAKHDDWVASAILQKSFRLLQETDPLGNPEHTLEIRPLDA